MTTPDPRQIGCGGWTPPSQPAEEKADDRLARMACSPRVLEPDEMVIQHLEQRLQGTNYGHNITLAHGELRWIAEAFQTIKRQRDEARSIAERFRTYVPEEAIVPLFIPWENSVLTQPDIT